MRLVGFNKKLQPQRSSYAVMKSPVKLEKCLIKRGPNKDFELFVNNSSKSLPSDRKIKFLESFEPSKTNSTPADVPIDKICSVEFINTKGVITSVKPARPVSTGLVHELTLTDQDVSITLSAWDNNIHKFEQWKTYIFENILKCLMFQE